MLHNITVPRCEYTIDCSNATQLTKDIHYVTKYLFPDEYTINIIKGGNTNLLYLMTPNNNKHKKLLIRIYGDNTEILINRKNEEMLFYELGELGFGPKLYATFTNGRIEQFYDNAKIYPLYKQSYFKQIAKTMVSMHCLKPNSLQNKKYPSLWLTISKWFDIASNIQFTDPEQQKQYESLNWKLIHKQIEMMKSYLPSPKNGNKIANVMKFIASKNNGTLNYNLVVSAAYSFMFESVLCHNDLIPANILYLPKYYEIKFIDFEYGAYNFRAFDFANHFCEYPGVSGSIDYYKRFPNRMHVNKFIKVYVNHLCERYKQFVSKDVLLVYEDGGKSYDEFLDVCVDIVTSFCGSAHYFWGLWSVLMCQYSNIVHFDFMKYAQIRFHKGYKHSLSILPSYLTFVKQKYLNAKL